MVDPISVWHTGRDIRRDTRGLFHHVRRFITPGCLLLVSEVRDSPYYYHVKHYDRAANLTSKGVFSTTAKAFWPSQTTYPSGGVGPAQIEIPQQAGQDESQLGHHKRDGDAGLRTLCRSPSWYGELRSAMASSSHRSGRQAGRRRV